MQKDGSHDVGASASGLPGPSSNPDATSSGFQSSASMRDRLEKLAEWRIDQSSIEFPQETRGIRGGNATVSRAFLASPSGDKDRTNQSDPTKNKGLDSGSSAGETSHERKAVAVKMMRISDDMARLLGLTVREAEFLVEFSHKNIIKLEGFVEDLSKDIVWLVFPWEENGTLRDFIASAEWEIPERVSLIDDVARGVEYLHSRRPPICHGDLKSLNVLVNSKCLAVITDFGSARRLKTEQLNTETKPAQSKPPEALSLEATFCASTNTITLTGNHYTLRWAAPELLFDGKPDLFSDIWALGWVAYEVMTGSIPFQGVKEMVVITHVIQGNLPSITGDARMSLIQTLCSLMLGCWSIDPSKRPTIEDFQRLIKWIPMVIPDLIRTSDAAASRARSPELLEMLGDMYRRQSDYPSALDFYTKAMDGYTHNGNMKGKVDALVHLGQVRRSRGEYDQAIPFYLEALQICTDLNDKARKAKALWGLAEVHRVRNEYGQAITFYSESLQIRDDIGNRPGRADALWGLAEVHVAQGNYSQAITFYSEALDIHAEINDRRGQARALQSLAEVYRLQNEYGQAITHLSESLQISTELGDRYARAYALARLADVHRDRGDYSDAIRLYTKAGELFAQIGRSQHATYTLHQADQLRLLYDREEAK